MMLAQMTKIFFRKGITVTSGNGDFLNAFQMHSEIGDFLQLALSASYYLI